MTEPLAADYSAALDYLYRRINFEKTPNFPYRDREWNLNRMRRLLELLGNPHLQYPTVHIAGTKGKGSTAALISGMLQAAGYRVGTYTSPHLSDLEERFAVDGQPCTRQELVALVDTVRASLAGAIPLECGWEVELTFFDVTTALGLLHFVRREVDIGVIEVGLGGRLDSTNVCQPLVSVITSIGFDHLKQLGNTLAAIAGEKAGIIKPGVPVVSGVIDPEPAQVIAATAATVGSSLYQRSRDFWVEYEPAAIGLPGCMRYAEHSTLSGWQFGPARLRMLGRHQAINAGVALATVSILRQLGWEVDDDDCLHGLAAASCPARIEVLARHPTVIVDTAHNIDSVQALVATLNECFAPGPRVLLMAVSRDKDVSGLLRLLLPEFNHVILTRFLGNPRGLPVAELSEHARQIVAEQSLTTVSMHRAETPQDAWDLWLRLSSPDSLLCITGSFFLAAEFGALRSKLQIPGGLPA